MRYKVRGVLPPESAREKLPLFRTDSLIVLTAASAARRLSSFTSANTRTSDLISHILLVVKSQKNPSTRLRLRPPVLRDKKTDEPYPREALGLRSTPARP